MTYRIEKKVIAMRNGVAGHRAWVCCWQSNDRAKAETRFARFSTAVHRPIRLRLIEVLAASERREVEA